MTLCARFPLHVFATDWIEGFRVCVVCGLGANAAAFRYAASHGYGNES